MQMISSVLENPVWRWWLQKTEFWTDLNRRTHEWRHIPHTAVRQALIFDSKLRKIGKHGVTSLEKREPSFYTPKCNPTRKKKTADRARQYQVFVIGKMKPRLVALFTTQTNIKRRNGDEDGRRRGPKEKKKKKKKKKKSHAIETTVRHSVVCRCSGEIG